MIALYRLYATDGSLLYVGITEDALKRLRPPLTPEQISRLTVLFRRPSTVAHQRTHTTTRKAAA